MTSVREQQAVRSGMERDATAAVITEKRVVADGVVTLELAPAGDAEGGTLATVRLPFPAADPAGKAPAPQPDFASS